MYPEHREVHLPHMGIMFTFGFICLRRGRTIVLSLFSRLNCDLLGRDPGSVQAVLFVPAVGVLLEVRQDARHVIAQGMLRLPIQLLAGAAEVQLVMIVRDIDHPGADEGVFTKYFVLSPGTQFGQSRRHVPRDPVLAVQLAPDQAL